MLERRAPHAPAEPTSPGLASSAALAPAPITRFTLGLGATEGIRLLHHYEPTTGELRTYRANGIGSYVLSTEIRLAPLARVVWLTAKVDFSQAIGLTSYSLREHQAEPTQSVRFDAQARVRFRTTTTVHAVQIGIGGGYASWRYDIAPPPQAGLERPTGDYDIVRAAVDLWVPIGSFAAYAEGGVGRAIDAPQLETRTASTKPWEADATLGVAYSPTPSQGASSTFQMKLFAGYARFWYELAPLAGRQDLPAAVTDQYLTAGLSAHVRFW